MDENLKKAKSEMERFADAFSVTDRFADNIRNLGDTAKNVFGDAANDTNKLIISLSELEDAFSLDHYINKLNDLKRLQESANDFQQKEIKKVEQEIKAMLSSSRGAKLFDFVGILENAKAKHEKILKKSYEDLYDELTNLARDITKRLGKSKLGAKFEAILLSKQGEEGIGGSIKKGLQISAAKFGLEGLEKITSTFNLISGTFTKISVAAGLWITSIKLLGDILIGTIDLSRRLKSYAGSVGIIGGFRNTAEISGEIQTGIAKGARFSDWISSGKYKEIVELIPTVIKDSNMFSRNLGQNLQNIASEMGRIVSESAAFNYTLEQAAEQSMRIYAAFGESRLEENFRKLNILSRTQMMGFEEFFGNMGGFESMFSSFGEKMWDVSLSIASSMEVFTKKLDKVLMQRALIGLYSAPVSQQLGLALAMGGFKDYELMTGGKPETYLTSVSKLYDRVKTNLSKSPLQIAGMAEFVNRYYGADVARRYAFNADFRKQFELALKQRNEDQINKLVEQASKDNLTLRSLDAIKESVSVLTKLVNYVEDIKNYIILLLSRLSLLKIFGLGTKSNLDYSTISSSKGGK